MSEWTRTDWRLPPSGATVEVVTPGGDQRVLVYESDLWWLPDQSMYVYFTPTHWRSVTERAKA